MLTQYLRKGDTVTIWSGGEEFTQWTYKESRKRDGKLFLVFENWDNSRLSIFSADHITALIRTERA